MGHVHNELTFGDTVSAILEGKPDKNLILVTGRAHPKLATDVAQQLGIDVLETTAYDFANGEMYVRYTESVARTCSSCKATATPSMTRSWNSSS